MTTTNKKRDAHKVTMYAWNLLRSRFDSISKSTAWPYALIRVSSDVCKWIRLSDSETITAKEWMDAGYGWNVDKEVERVLSDV